jgi:hypothetical protein
MNVGAAIKIAKELCPDKIGVIVAFDYKRNIWVVV